MTAPIVNPSLSVSDCPIEDLKHQANSTDRRRSSRIIAEIYEATIDPSHWDYVISMITKLTRSKSACLYYKNRDQRITSNIASYGLPASEFVRFNKHCDSLDAMFYSRGGGKSEEADFIHCCPGSDGVMLEDSGFYLEWMKPNGYYHVGGVQLIHNDIDKAGIAIFRDQESGVWSNGGLRVIDDILPHLQCALNIHSEFAYVRYKQNAMLNGLDRFVIGLILYDENARPIYINPTAQAIIDGHPAMRLQDGELILSNSEDHEKLRNVIVQASKIDPDDSWKRSVAIGVTHADLEAPLPLLITPMHANLITSGLDYKGAKVAVFLNDPKQQQSISVDNLVSVYNMSPPEARVAISIANGHSIDETAHLSNLSSHTIRTHLKAVFHKIGVSRQSEIIHQLLTGPLAGSQVVKLQLREATLIPTTHQKKLAKKATRSTSRKSK